MAKCAVSTPPPSAATAVLSPLWRAGRLVGIYQHCRRSRCISLAAAAYSVALAALTVGVFLPCCVYDLLRERFQLTWILVNKTITFLFTCMMLVSMAGVWWAQLKADVYVGALNDIIVNSELDARWLQSTVGRTVAAVGATITVSVGAHVALQLALPDIIYVIQPLRSLGYMGAVARCADAAMLLAWGLHAYGVIARIVFDVCLGCAAARRALDSAADGLASTGGRTDTAAWRRAAARIDSAVNGMAAVNRLYGWPLLLLVSATLCQVLLCIYYMLLTGTSPKAGQYAAGTTAAGAFAVQASWLALGLVIMLLLFEFGDGVKRAAASAVRSLRRRGSHTPPDTEAKENAQWLVDDITSGGLALSAAGFFHFDRTCIVASVSTVATYLIVLLQTHDGSTGGAVHPIGGNASAIGA